MDKKKYQKMTKDELISIIEKLLEFNLENEVLLNNIHNNKNPKWEKTLRKVQREVENHMGSYTKAYHHYLEYSHTCTDNSDLLKLSLECLDYFFEELDLYSECPQDLIEYTDQILNSASKIAVDLDQHEDIIRIYNTIFSSNNLFDEALEMFVDTFYTYVPCEIIEAFEEDE